MTAAVLDPVKGRICRRNKAVGNVLKDGGPDRSVGHAKYSLHPPRSYTLSNQQ